MGDTGDDVLIGGTGDDELIGGTGRDILTGGDGADQFVLHAALSATTNVDQLTDFDGGVDTIQLSRSVFTALALGTLDADAFQSGAGVTTAADADDRILYDTTTGALYYDVNGTAAGGPIQIATLTGAPALSASDITVIAPPLNAGAVIAPAASAANRLTAPTATSADSHAHQIIQGTSGDDLFAGRGGDDELTGGAGSDTAWYGGFAQEYLLATEDGVLTVTDRQAVNGDEGTDQLTTIEQLQFSDARLTVTSERRVNSETAADQNDGRVTALVDGGYVVTWESFEQDGDFNGVYLQRYDAAGVAVGGEVQVNTETANDQSDSAVTGLADGGYVVTWTSSLQDGSGAGVYLQQYDTAGATVGGEVLVNSTTANSQSDSAVTGLADGGYVVTWESDGGQDGDGYGIYAQRYDAAGNRVGIEVQVHSTIAGDQNQSAVTALADGGYVVTWTSEELDGEHGSIALQRYDMAGSAVGGEVLVNSTTAGDQEDSAVAALADGGYVVTWESDGQDGDNEGTYLQRYDADGDQVGGEVRVNRTTVGDQQDSAVTALADGGYAVTWESSGQDGDGYGIYVQRYNAAGEAVGLVVTGTAGDERLNIGTHQLLTVDGAGGNDTLTGGASADILLGGTGTDSLIGNAGDDYLNGGIGADRLLGGLGNDTYVVDN
ncbi:MAG: hypothetical protein HP494_19180, partial [Nitrospira sp.]|nr:hypothetical protein [Nitrospira sp.]